jgi:hypothetical protein
MDRRRRENYQVKFEDIDDPQSASQLSSKELFMSKQEIMEVIIPASQLPIDHTDLNGYEIHDLTTGIKVVIESHRNAFSTYGTSIPKSETVLDSTGTYFD